MPLHKLSLHNNNNLDWLVAKFHVSLQETSCSKLTSELHLVRRPKNTLCVSTKVIMVVEILDFFELHFV
jgi:hypothetical protein